MRVLYYRISACYIITHPRVILSHLYVRVEIACKNNKFHQKNVKDCKLSNTIYGYLTSM